MGQSNQRKLPLSRRQERGAKTWASAGAGVVGGFHEFVMATPRQKVAGRKEGHVEKERGSRGREEDALRGTCQLWYKLDDFKIV